MVHKKEEGAYHRIEKLTKEMPGFFSPGRGLPLLIPEYSGINKEQRIPDRSKTAHRKPPVMLPDIFLFIFIVHLKRLSYLSLLVSGSLHSLGYIFPFLLCLSLLFFLSNF